MLAPLDAGFRHIASARPDAVAVTMLHDDAAIAFAYTYRELDQRARATAAALQQAGLLPGDRALLAYPEGPEFLAAFLGALYAGVIAVPAPPPSPVRGRDAMRRLDAIRQDAGARCLLTDSGSLPQLAGGLSLPVLVTDAPDSKVTAGDWRPVTVIESTPAYLQYTSGSTTVPRGVVITHAMVNNYLAMCRSAFPWQDNSVALTWNPHTHDLGLIEGLLNPLLAGVPIYIMSPWSFLRRPLRWLEAIARYRVTHSSAATFAYRLCVEQAAQSRLTALDLRTWRHAFIGAETIAPPVVEAFCTAFAGAGLSRETIVPAYGLAEATLAVTAKAAGTAWRAQTLTVDGRALALTSCGRPLPGIELQLVDPATRQAVAPGQVGEVWVRGPGVAPGYWGDPDRSAEIFGVSMAGAPAAGAQPGYLRTGDLGMLVDGELYLAGRLKEMLIVRGQNYYPQDIERTVHEAHAALAGREVIAFAHAGEDGERLVLICEVDRQSARSQNLEELLEVLRMAVAKSLGLPLIAIWLVRRGELPRTTSGKLQRTLCRELWFTGQMKPLAAWEAAQRQPTVAPSRRPSESIDDGVAAIWRELLGRTNIPPDVDFYTLGGDSLLIFQMVLAVEALCGQGVPVRFFHRPTLGHLLQLVSGDESGDASGAEAAGKTPAFIALPSHPKASLAERVRYRAPNFLRSVLRRYRAAVAEPLRREMAQMSYLDGWQHAQTTAYGSWRQHLAYPGLHHWLANLQDSFAFRGALHDVAADSIAAAHTSAIVQRVIGGESPERVIPVLQQSLLPFTRSLGGLLDARSAAWPAVAQGGDLPFVELSGLEHLLLNGREAPTIFLFYHSGCEYPGMVALSRLLANPLRLFQHRVVYADILHRLHKTSQADRSNRRAYQLMLARQTLAAGGHFLIAADMIRSKLTGAEGQPVMLGRRRYALMTGYIDLALATGARLVPLILRFQTGGRVHLQINRPLDAGDPGQTPDRRKQLVAEQVGNYLTAAWQAYPASVAWQTLEALAVAA